MAYFWKGIFVSNNEAYIRGRGRLEKSGNEICVRENLGKSETNWKSRNHFLHVFIIGNNAFSDKNFRYVHLNSKVST